MCLNIAIFDELSSHLDEILNLGSKCYLNETSSAQVCKIKRLYLVPKKIKTLFYVEGINWFFVCFQSRRYYELTLLLCFVEEGSINSHLGIIFFVSQYLPKSFCLFPIDTKSFINQCITRQFYNSNNNSSIVLTKEIVKKQSCIITFYIY
jgi:hypothetical protein